MLVMHSLSLLPQGTALKGSTAVSGFSEIVGVDDLPGSSQTDLRCAGLATSDGDCIGATRDSRNRSEEI